MNNVKDFGARGDGVADDAAAIQHAIDHAVAAGGGIVYFPSGKYLIASSPRKDTYALLIEGSNITFKGDGIDATTLIQGQIAANLHPNHDAPYYYSTAVLSLRRCSVNDYDNTVPLYKFNPARRGDQSVALVSSADVNHFAVGDSVYLTGGANANLTLSEMNFVVSADVETGAIKLLYPLSKDIDGSVYGIGNTTACTNRNIAIEDMTIHASSFLAAEQTYGLRIERVRVEIDPTLGPARPGVSNLNALRGVTLRDCEFICPAHERAGNLQLGRSCGDVLIDHCTFVFDTHNGVTDGGAGEGGYNIRILNNTIHYTGTTDPTVYESPVTVGIAWDMVFDNNLVTISSVTGNHYGITDLDPYPCHGLRISNNRIYLKSPRATGIKIHNACLVEGNEIHTYRNGISTQQAMGVGSRIVNNTIVSEGDGIPIFLADYSHDLAVISNTIRAADGVTLSHGIYVADVGLQTKSAQIIGNRGKVEIANSLHEVGLINEHNLA